MKVLESDDRLLVVEAEPGAGLSWTLCMKSIKEAQEGKFVGHYTTAPNFPDGYGYLEIFKSVLDKCKIEYRFSKHSNILTIGAGRIKLLSSIEDYVGASFDLIVSDHSKNVGVYDAFKAKQVLMGVYPNEECWWNQLEPKYVQMKLDDNIFFCDDKYKTWVRESIPDKFFK